jgi:hypothetical protein
MGTVCGIGVDYGFLPPSFSRLNLPREKVPATLSPQSFNLIRRLAGA